MVKKEMMLKITVGRTMMKIREAPLNVSSGEVFFTKETRLSISMCKEQHPKKLTVLVSKETQTEALGLDSIKKLLTRVTCMEEREYRKWERTRGSH